MSKFRLLWAFLLVAGVLAARTVRVENVICNPEADVVVPVTLDDAQGLSVVSLILNYNAEVLTLTDVEQGELKDIFSFDFTVVDDTPGQVKIISVSPADITDAVGGTLALLRFNVRKGTEEMYSDIALADVTFYEETMTVDMSVQQATTPISGMIRSFSGSATCVERLTAHALSVAEGTNLATLELKKADTLLISDDKVTPITITKELIHSGEVVLRAPAYGWSTGRYTILQVPEKTAPIVFQLDDKPEKSSYETVTENGVTTYSILVDIEDELTITLGASLEDEESGLDERDKSKLRSYLKDRLDDRYTAVLVTGELEDIRLGIDLGICPKIETPPASLLSASDETVATVVYEKPTLSVIGFEPKTGAVKIRVVPAEGASIVDSVVTGIFQVYGADSLSSTMTVLEDVEINAEKYLNADTIGEVTFGITLGDKSFIKIKAETRE